jgi:PAS domain S-box-containing protein
VWKNADIRTTTKVRARTIAVAYIVIALLWVVMTEAVLGTTPTPRLLNRLGFVLVSDVALYLYAARWSRREVEHWVSASFESAAWAMLGIDKHGIIRRANQRASEMFGYESNELAGQPLDILIPERLREQHHTHLGTYFAAPRTRPMGIGKELVGTRKDGSEFPVEVSLNFSHLASDGLVDAFISETTERLKLERDARRNETLTALGAIAAGVAHELNNPLAVVSSRIELMLAADTELSPQMREDLEVVHRNARRASRIAAELLNSARQQPRERKLFQLSDMVDETLPLFREQMRREGIAITTMFDSSLPRVVGDRIALGQVLINLLTNARDAMSEGGGLIRIETSAAPGRPGFVQLMVSDTGRGIPADALPRIFDVFYTTKSTGTGLGLWLCRRIMLEHQGRIDVQSEVGKGTTFVMTLPAEASGDAAIG